jgi:transglutaminase superfamily protein
MMRNKWKRWAVPVLCLSLLVLFLFFSGSPWAARVRHTLKRTAVKAEMKLASWRGHEPRLVSIAGHLNEPGVQIQALDSRSGWATLTGNDGRFVLPDVMWYPGASYELVISRDEFTGRLIKVRAPETFPESGVFSVGELDVDRGAQVEIASLIGVNSITREDFDVKNRDYYKALFDKLTAGKQSDEEKIGAIHEYVACKLNYNETQWELGSPRRVLESGSEYCGHLSTAMETLNAIGGYRTRAINVIDINHPTGTHMVVEVFYDGGWHLYDPTFGVKFQRKGGQVASYRDVRLDTSLITEDLFAKFDAKFRRHLMDILPAAYATGQHHFYYFKDKP